MVENRTRRSHHSHPRRPPPASGTENAAKVSSSRLDEGVRDEELAEETRGDDEFDRGTADPEAPTADSAEQRRPLRPAVNEPMAEELDDADPADVAEQSRGAELDEDEYR